MRITKKFTGDASIGKKVFHPAAREGPDIVKQIEDAQANLDHLYQAWKQRLESQEQEMTRKSMPAAAVSAASSLCENATLSFPPNAVTSSTDVLSGASCTVRTPGGMVDTNMSDKGHANCTREISETAAWLDQANTIMSKEITSIQMQTEIESELQTLSSLIKRAPVILKMAAEIQKILCNECKPETCNALQSSVHKLPSCPDLRILCTGQPRIYDSAVFTPTAGKRKRSLSDDDSATESPNNPMKMLASLSSQAAPVPINTNSPKTVTEDARTFVDFLQSVGVEKPQN